MIHARRYRHNNFVLELLQRFNEAAAIIFGRWSLHRSWQEGFNEGQQAERARIYNGGDALTLPAHWARLRLQRLREHEEMKAAYPDNDADALAGQAPMRPAHD